MLTLTSLYAYVLLYLVGVQDRAWFLNQVSCCTHYILNRFINLILELFMQQYHKTDSDVNLLREVAAFM